MMKILSCINLPIIMKRSLTINLFNQISTALTGSISVVYGLVIYFVFSCNFSKAILFAIYSFINVIHSIGALFFRGRPSAISRLIISIIIFSVNTVKFAWSWPHVSNEVFKSSPSLANLNASAMMAMVFRMVSCTSYKHSSPYFILSGLAHAVSSLCYRVSCRKLFCSLATTGFRLSSPDILSLKYLFYAAIAFTQISCVSRFARLDLPNHKKLSIFIANHFNFCAHETYYNVKLIGLKL